MIARTTFCLLALTGFAFAQWLMPRPIRSSDVMGALGFMPIPQDTDGTIGTRAVRPSGVAVSRPLSSKLSDTVSVLDFGAQCDGVTDDTAAVMASMASGRAISVPGLTTVCRTSIDNGNFTGVFVGPGRIMDNIGHLRAPLVHHALTPPGLFGYGGNVVQAFDGDFRNNPRAQEQRVLGSALQIGGPSGTYQYFEPPELAGEYLYTFLGSGGDDGNGHRTGLAGHQWIGYHAGPGGDLVGWGASCTIAGAASAGQSNNGFPSCSLLSGAMTAAGQDVGLQGVGDINFNDHGYRAFATGFNLNLNRTVSAAGAPAGKGAGWMTYRSQSIGSVPVDAAFTASGPHKMVVDAVDSSYGNQANSAPSAAVAAGAGQRYYGNSSSSDSAHYPWNVTLGTEWMDYSPVGGWEFVIGGSATVRATAGGVQTPQIRAVAGLGACAAANEGTRSAVSDAMSPTFLGTLTGGGRVHAPAYCNGSVWVAG